MQIVISTDIAALAQRLNATAEQVPAATQAGIQAVTAVVEKVVERQIGQIYAADIPTRNQVSSFNATGKKGPRAASSDPAWTRSGDLLKGLTSGYPDPFTGEISIQGPAAVYAESRHELGVSWMPKNPAVGIVRENPFMQEAIDITAPQIDPVFENAFENAIKSGG